MRLEPHLEARKRAQLLNFDLGLVEGGAVSVSGMCRLSVRFLFLPSYIYAISLLLPIKRADVQPASSTPHHPSSLQLVIIYHSFLESAEGSPKESN